MPRPPIVPHRVNRKRRMARAQARLKLRGRISRKFAVSAYGAMREIVLSRPKPLPVRKEGLSLCAFLPSPTRGKGRGWGEQRQTLDLLGISNLLLTCSGRTLVEGRAIG